MIRELIHKWIDLERDRQDSIWGVQRHTESEWTLILLEEVADIASLMNRRNQNPREYQDQLLHVAAVAVAALEQLGLEDEPTCLGEMNWGNPQAARILRESRLQKSGW